MWELFYSFGDRQHHSHPCGVWDRRSGETEDKFGGIVKTTFKFDMLKSLCGPQPFNLQNSPLVEDLDEMIGRLSEPMHSQVLTCIYRRRDCKRIELFGAFCAFPV